MKKILVIQTASIGDVILATPVIGTLHQNFPAAGIDILVKKGNETLFRDHPWLHQVVTWDKSAKYKDLFRIIRRIRGEQYDLVINIQRFASSGLITVLSKAVMTIGFSKNPFSYFFDIPLIIL